MPVTAGVTVEEAFQSVRLVELAIFLKAWQDL